MDLISLGKKSSFRSALLYSLCFGLLISWLLLFRCYVYHGSSLPKEPKLVADSNVGIQKKKDEKWYLIFIDNTKVGYKKEETIPFEDGFIYTDTTYLRIKLIGFEQDVLIKSNVITDANDRINNFNITFETGTITSRLDGKVEGELLNLSFQSGTFKKTFSSRLTDPFYVGNYKHIYKYMLKNPPKDKFKITFLNPLTMKFDTINVRLVGKQKTENSVSELTVFELEYGGLTQQVVVDENGTVLREEGLMGFRLELARGPSDVKDLVASEDLALASSVEPKGKRISQPHRITGLRIRSNLRDIPLDHRQRLEGNEIVIKVEPLPSDDSSPSEDRPKEFTLPSFGIEADHPKLVEIAQRLAGEGSKPVIVARRALAFVYSKLEKRPLLSMPSAIAALETMAGDCTEHAFLLTALLRACNIPARVVAGLTMHEGRFFYHAWTEAYLGGWVSMDPTLNQMPCDATHIKLFYFDDLLSDSGKALGPFAAQLGKTKIEIVGFSYD